MKYFRRILKHYIIMLLLFTKTIAEEDPRVELNSAFDALEQWVIGRIALAIREHEEIYHDRWGKTND